MHTILRPVGNWMSGWSRFCPWRRRASRRHARAEGGLLRPEASAGALDYLERLDRHRYPFENLAVIAEALQQLLDSGGERKAIGDLAALRDALDRVTAYQDFQPNRFHRREANRRLRALSQHREVQP